MTRNDVHRFSLKEKGTSTLGGRRVWFDPDVLRLNYEGRGELLGEFQGDDMVLVITRTGEYYMTNFDAANHYDDNILRIEKFRPGHVWTALLNDADQKFPYIKRFTFEPSTKRQRYLGENPASTLIALSDHAGARFRVTFGGADAFREPMEVDAAEFIAVKSFKAKGKRLTTWVIDSVEELDPDPVADEREGEQDVTDGTETQVSDADVPDSATDDISDDELADEINGQARLFE